jgi:uncharacterized protein YlxP (DUF503 family)
LRSTRRVRWNASCDAPGVAFVCLLQIELHLPANGSLKGKRKQLQPLKAGLQRRFGAAVAETDHHDLWQRATLAAVLVGRKASVLSDEAAGVERFVHAQFPDGARVERRIVSAEEILQ